MKKKLLALAMAAALPMGAQADVTIYGLAHLSIDFVDPDVGQSLTDVESRASRIGFKGSEDLGDGLKMVWQVESQVNMSDNKTDYLAGRNTFIGLAGGFGTFLYGRHDTPVKISTGSMDIFADTIADYNAAGMGAIIDIRANDAIAYVSPAMGGFTFIGALVPDADYDATGDEVGAYSLAGMWSSGAFTVAGGYESLDDLVGGVDAAHWRIGAGYNGEVFVVNGIYQDAGDFGYDSFVINGGYKFGNNMLKAGYSNVDPDNASSIDGWVIGLDHDFSKRSKMYVMYASSEGDLQQTNATGEQDGFSLGMIHKF